VATLKERIVTAVHSTPGLTDREMTDRLFGPDVGPQAINQVARGLSIARQIVRRPREDGKIGNYPADSQHLEAVGRPIPYKYTQSEMLSEDEVKRKLQAWLESSGWRVSVVWGRDAGIDLDAKRNGQRWIIEAKGCGSLNPMRVNYFLSILGELLQRMDDPNARYSIALPEMRQYRRLWQRLPQLAKSRTTISALFIDPSGRVDEVSANS